MKWFRSYIGTLTWAANGKLAPLAIPRGNYLRRLVFYLSGSLDLSAGTASGTARSEGPANVITEVRVKGDGIGIMKVLDGSGLFLSTLLHNRVRFPTTIPAGGAATGQAFNSGFTIDFLLPAKSNIRPIDTILDTRMFSTLDLEVDCSANLRDALFSGNDRTEANAAATILVFGDYERPHSNFGQPSLYMQYMSSRQVIAAASKFDFPLSVDQSYKNIIISAQNQASGGQYTGNNAILVDYSLVLNTNIYPMNQINFLCQQALDCFDLELTSKQAGANFLMFDADKMLKEILSSYRGSSLSFSMNVTVPSGTNKINIYPGVILPLSVDAQGKVCQPAASVARPFAPGRTAPAMS